MGLSYSDVRGVIDFKSKRPSAGYTFPMLPRLNKVIGNLEEGQTHVLSGLVSSDTTSFIDQNYVISVLLQWYNKDVSERNPLKIFYYSMRDSELKRIQLLLCNYLKLVEGLRTDISTLNNQVGKLYELSEDSVLKTAIEDASYFFDEVLDDEILVIKSGQYKPTDIYNDITDYMRSIGTVNSDDSYSLNKDHENSLVLVIIDSTDYFLPDSDGFGVITGNNLNEKFQRQIKYLKTQYNTSFVVSVPIISGYIRTAKDTEPHYRQLGSYSAVADKGLIIYNSIAENNNKFYNGEPELYVTSKGNILMRTWHVVRNVDGLESVFDRVFFLPGTSYMKEYSFNNSLTSIDIVLDELGKDTYFKE